MNDKEIHDLIIAVAKGFRICWMPDNDEGRRIIRIGNHKDEGCECAFFANGEYIALYNCDRMDFYRVERLFP